MSVESFLTREVRLPSAPAIAAQILEVVRSGSESNQSLARVVAADPAISAKLLSVANSPIYGQGVPVARIEQAIALMGLNTVKNIALSFAVIHELVPRGGRRFDLQHFLKHAVTSAVAAELMGLRMGRQGEEYFAAALLQDVGMLVFAMLDADAYDRVLAEHVAGREPLINIETRRFGFDHQELGAELLRRWGLPESVCAPIEHHHAPEDAPQAHRQTSEILCVADGLANLYHETQGAQLFGQLHFMLSNHFERHEEIDAFIDEVACRAEELLAVYDIGDGVIKPYSQLLQEANEELGRLNLSYAQLVMELKQAKTTADKLAAELLIANDQLSALAARDGLTGLFNHRHFQDALRREVTDSAFGARPLSVILLDVDNFKRINDQHGHPAGDAVLKEIAEFLGSVVRETDLVARYGGEEFAIILGNTNTRKALAIAERVRQGIEAVEVRVNSATIRTTVSIGLCGVEAYTPEMTARRMTDAADKALYSAKKAGRNRIVLAR